MLFGNDRIKDIFLENKSSLKKPKKFFKKYKKKKLYLLYLAPYRTSSDLNLIIKKNITEDRIKFDFNFDFNENSLAVLNQKFYLAIFSNNCLLQFDNISINKKNNL